MGEKQMTDDEYEQRAYDWGCRERLKKRPLHLNPFFRGGGEYEAFHNGRRGRSLTATVSLRGLIGKLIDRLPKPSQWQPLV